MAGDGITIEDNVDRLFHELADVAQRFDKGVKRATLDSMILLERHVVIDHLTGGTTSTRLGSRSGALRQNFQVTPTITRDPEGGYVGRITVGPPADKYGRTHEKGMTIRAAGKMLTIPLPAARAGGDPHGPARFTAAELRRDPAKGGFTGTFVAKGVIFGKLGMTGGAHPRQKKGFEIGGAKGSIVPLFVLKDHVTIPPRPFISSTLREQAQAVTDIYVRRIVVAFGASAGA